MTIHIAKPSRLPKRREDDAGKGDQWRVDVPGERRHESRKPKEPLKCRSPSLATSWVAWSHASSDFCGGQIQRCLAASIRWLNCLPSSTVHDACSSSSYRVRRYKYDSFGIWNEFLSRKKASWALSRVHVWNETEIKLKQNWNKTVLFQFHFSRSHMWNETETVLKLF